ncbi:MAG: hypothetical protein O7E52_29030 [Candidatus Poribacteria bacterium]|nr:hypothetical protein [Candidatus Poribacteria bacterium]
MKSDHPMFIILPQFRQPLCLRFALPFSLLLTLLAPHLITSRCAAQVLSPTEESTTWAHPLLNVPLDDPMASEVYDFVDRVVLKYQLKGILKNRRPYTHGKVSKILDQLRVGNFPLTRIERKRLARLTRYFSVESSPLLQAKGEDYRLDLNLELGQISTHRTKPANPSGTEYAWQTRPIVRGGVRDDFAFATDLRFYLITNTVLQNTVRVEVEENQSGENFITAGLVPAYAKFKLPWFELLVGKDNLSWGPGRHGNLLLSANPLPMDMIQIQAQYGKIGFQAFTAIAESLHGKKTLSGHRLDLNLWDRVNLGIAETVVIGEENFELRFLNPFTIYTVTELSGEGILKGPKETSLGNTLISGTMELRILRNLGLYGELLIDDFQPRYGLNSYRHWASKFGIQLGIQLVDPLSIDNTDLRIEYAFLNQFAYTHKSPINAYTHFNRLIGHEIGSDADDLWISFRHWLTDALSGALTYELERHGEGDVTLPHPADAPPDDRWEFLSGTPEVTHAFSVEGQYHAIGNFLVKGRYTFSRITNLDRRKGVQDNQYEVVLMALYRL